MKRNRVKKPAPRKLLAVPVFKDPFNRSKRHAIDVVRWLLLSNDINDMWVGAYNDQKAVAHDSLFVLCEKPHETVIADLRKDMRETYSFSVPVNTKFETYFREISMDEIDDPRYRIYPLVGHLKGKYGAGILPKGRSKKFFSIPS